MFEIANCESINQSSYRALLSYSPHRYQMTLIDIIMSIHILQNEIKKARA